MSEKELERKRNNRIALIIAGICFLLIIILFMKMSKSGLIEGDYSPRKCSCGNLADGGAYFVGGNISEAYCKEDYQRMKEIHENLDNKSSDNIECKVCHREFKKGSENAKSISNRNMCSQCYKNFKGASNAVNELPQD